MTRLLCIVALSLIVLSGCDPSYSDVRDVPALPGSKASPLLVTPTLRIPDLPKSYNPADLWSPALQVDSLAGRTYGVPMLGHQEHFIRDTVSAEDIKVFLDAQLSARGFEQSRAPERWAIRYIQSGARQPKVAAWVRDAPTKDGGTDRTVVAVAYATPWPPGQDDTHTTFYVVFLGRGVVRPADGRAASGVAPTGAMQ